MTQPLWYTRSVVVVADVARSLAFYIERLGFTQDWASVEDGRRASPRSAAAAAS